MTANEVREMLREHVGEGTQVELAKKMGISPTYLNDILQGAREPGGCVLDWLGLKRVADYVPKRKAKPA
jgi:hypothetical protein